MRCRLLAFALLSAALSACTILPQPTPTDLYQLPPSSLAAASPSGNAASTGPLIEGLRIASPATSDALGGNRLLVMTQDNSFQAWPGVRWAAPTPLLWRDWLLDALWRDGRIGQLSSSGERLQARLELGGMLRALHTVYQQGQPVAVIRYDARLVDISSRSITASRRFEAQQIMEEDTAAAAVRALGQAGDQLVAELLEWLLEEGGQDSGS